MIEINSDRLWRRIEALSRITDPARALDTPRLRCLLCSGAGLAR